MPPPPLPPATSESAHLAYGRAVAVSLPAILAWFSASLFVLPRLTFLLSQAPAVSDRLPLLHRLLNGSDTLRHNFWFIVAVPGVLLLLLEFRTRFWARLRSAALLTAAILCNAAVFAWLLLVLSGALVFTSLCG